MSRLAYLSQELYCGVGEGARLSEGYIVCHLEKNLVIKKKDKDAFGLGK